MKIAVIILHYGKLETTLKTLKNLKKKIADNRLILINNTTQDISKLTKIIPDTKIIENKANLGFAKAVNQGIRAALKDKSVEAVFLMNNDLVFTFGSLDMLRKTLFEKSDHGIVSPVIHHSGNLYDWGGKISKLTGNVKHMNFEQKPKKIISVDHIAGAAMLIKRTLIDEIGLFDERFFIYFEDADFCLRTTHAGHKIIIDSRIVVEHATSSGSVPLKRTLYQWLSHLKFSFKYFPLTIYPTALIYDFIFYPLIILKITLTSMLR